MRRWLRLLANGLCRSCFAAYLDDFKLNLGVTILRTAADSLNDCIDKQARSLAICRWGLRSLLVLAIVGTITVQKVVAEELLNPVEKLLDQTWLLGLYGHLEDVKVFVSTQLFFTFVLCNLFCDTIVSSILAKFLDMTESLGLLLTKCLLTECNQLFVLAFADTLGNLVQTVIH